MTGPDPVLVACEYSQTVTRALRRHGVEAYSCDLLPTEGDPAWHIQGDAIAISRSRRWAALIAHPPCTHLTLAGARWFYDPRFPDKARDRDEAIAFWLGLWGADIALAAFENPQPLGYVMQRIGRPTQRVQPWQFGVPETKGICLWLRGFRPLTVTHSDRGDLFTLPAPRERTARVHRMAPGPRRALERSRFYDPIADAMALQWFPR